ncbi:MAG TPA: COR domain-containing protein [Candidatus Kapabacteria bacterium]|nr:COR domain-containing protein [Candidatus Kapabacteria bacterium]
MAFFDKEKLNKIKDSKELEKKRSIMIVDDEEHMLNSLKSMFNEDYEVITARNGQEALEIIKQLKCPEEIGAIIADQRMPGLEGVQLFIKLKDIIPDTPRIILTAYDDDKVKMDAVNEAQIHQFILKNFDHQDLKAIIKDSVEDFEIRKQSKISPIEIVKKGKSAVRDYLESLKKDEIHQLNEVKLLLVGDGGSGKTSLVRRIMKEPFNVSEPQTHGIYINSWEINRDKMDIIVHTWDFGGQEIMHATHQFFLSKRSIYLLVLDGRKDEKTEYWLKHIESFGGDSPVLVVINKIDENPSFEVNRKFLQDKYKNIKGFYRVSCKTADGINDFVHDLENELAKVEMIQTTWPGSWFHVKTGLENMTGHFISYWEYRGVCENKDINDESSQNTLVNFLNDLGVVLHFKDLALKDTYVLEPKWVTQAVYKIINSKKLATDSGVLELKLLDDILGQKTDTDFYYPPDKYMYIIELMKKFELCYHINDDCVLIPDILEVEEKSFDFDYKSSLKFIIAYDFLPRSVMSRFIVNMHQDIKNNLRWRTGVVLEDMHFQSTAVVKADYEAKRIYINVNGRQKRDYFAALLVVLRRINKSFEKLETTEMIPIPDDPDISVDYEHLIRLEEEGIEFYLPGKSKNKYKVKDLLGTIATVNATEEEILQILRKIKSDQDTMESLMKKANDAILLQPNIMGFGINLNNLIQKALHKKEKNESDG